MHLEPIDRGSSPLLPCDHYAGSRKFLIKALSLRDTLGDMFDITLDLEDGAKAENRLSIAEDMLEEITSPSHNGKRIGLRLPSIKDPLFSRIASLYLNELGTRIRSITVPKLRNASEFFNTKKKLLNSLRSRDTPQSLSPPPLTLPPLHLLIENSEILFELRQIGTDPDVKTFEIGIMDFISSFNGNILMSECDDLREFKNPTINYLKSTVVCAAASCNITPVHSVCREYANLEKLRAFCAQAKQIGFSRMWSIHPAQIPIIITFFTPDQDEIEEAHLILTRAKENDWGPIPFNKRLHDLASYRYYAHLLIRANSLGMSTPTDAVDLAKQIKQY